MKLSGHIHQSGYEEALRSRIAGTGSRAGMVLGIMVWFAYIKLDGRFYLRSGSLRAFLAWPGSDGANRQQQLKNLFTETIIYAPLDPLKFHLFKRCPVQ